VYIHITFLLQARQIAYSLIAQKKLVPTDLAKRFWEEYYRESWRGYGASVSAVFEKLRKDTDPFEAAAQQFDGKGSYGNGAAMRVHPVSIL
jgi:poly(ADP-ribose) glycohydrolase ARH3